MSRGNRRQNIFLDDVDRQDFLKTLAEVCQKTDWRIHACCLMRNHYHLVIGQLGRLGLREADLDARRKHDPGKGA